jgi:hypothetical protein
MKRLTVLTTTTYDNQNSFENLKRTINSFRDNCNLNEYLHIVGYDKKSQDDASYLENIRSISNIIVNYGNNLGIAGNLILLNRMVKTDFVLILEHDWIFNKKLDFNMIMDVMNKYEFINYIRFNKRNNIEFEPFDSKLVYEDRVKEIDLLKTWSYSGNPHIIKKKFFKEFVIPIIINSSWKNHPTKGVENPLTEIIKTDTKKDYGTYLYGKLNDGPIVTHIGD